MRLCSVTLVGGWEEWLWYALEAAAPAVEASVVVSSGPLQASSAARDSLQLVEIGPGATRGQALRAGLEEAAREGASHVLLLGPAEVYARQELLWCRRLLEETTLHGARLELPPRQHERHHDPETTDGVLIRHLALTPLRPTRGSFRAGVVGGAPVVRWCRLEGLAVDSEGRLFEPTGEQVDRSPWRLKLATTHFWDLSSIAPGPGVPFPGWASVPQVLRAGGGPGHPQLEAWGLRG